MAKVAIRQNPSRDAGVLPHLEPKVAKYSNGLADTTIGDDMVIKLSIAISLRRIADKLDQFYDNGVTMAQT
jgi:hypothetical protein